MPIEFYCPGCGNLMRTPDETAGRKGRCPTCQLKVQIPAGTVASASSENAAARAATISGTSATNSQPIRFNCGSCGKTLSVAAANAGKTGQCPHCSARMSIPNRSSKSATQHETRWKGAPKQQAAPAIARSSTPASPQPAPLLTAGGAKIEFLCSNCREVVRVGSAAAGKKGQCPRCQAVIQIPTKTTTVAGLEPIPGPTPKRNPPQRPTAQKPAASGLTPLPSQPNATPSHSAPPGEISGLTPLPSEPMPSSGLTPLDSSPLSPLEPLGLTALEPTGIDGLGDGLFGVDQSDINNPFAEDPGSFRAPALTMGMPVPRKTGRANTGERTGAEIATMICGGCLVFYATAQVIVVILSMFMQGAAAFSMMERLGEGGNDQARATGFVVGQIIAVALSGFVMLTILAGGIQMMRFKTWGLCLAACILTMMPCNCFCLLGLPIGIWGTAMLSQSSIKSKFS